MDNKHTGNRIIILGFHGCGRDRFAEKLQNKTGLPLIHLRDIPLPAHWENIPQEEIDQKAEKMISGEKWIFEGDHYRTYSVLFRSCDMIIFLDYTETLYKNGTMERINKELAAMGSSSFLYKQYSRTESLIRFYHKHIRKRVYRMIEKYPDKQAVILPTSLQADEWLSDI